MKGPLILAGVVAIAVVGVAAVAARSNTRPHVLSVRLPGGVIGQIHHAGATPPRVDVTADATPVGLFDGAPADWRLVFPFAASDRLSMDMDRRMAALAPDLDRPWLPASTTRPRWRTPRRARGAMPWSRPFPAAMKVPGACGRRQGAQARRLASSPTPLAIATLEPRPPSRRRRRTRAE